MSQLQELIELYCPAGVEYKTLGELGTFYRGSSFQKKDFVDKGIPCIHYGQIHTQFNLRANAVVSYLDPTFAAKMKRAKPGSLIIATTSEDALAVGKAIAWMGNTEVVISNDAYIYEHQMNPMYMAYVFASDLYQQPKLRYVTGTKVCRVHEKNISKIPIPVPPVEVQREIVRLLDAHTHAHGLLRQQIEEEIQLEHEYRLAAIESKFISMFGNPFDSNQWSTKRLGDITTKVGSGATPRGGKSAYVDDGISLIRSMNVYDDGFMYDGLAHIGNAQAEALAGVTVEADDVLLNITGASIARCCIVPSDVLPARVNQHVCIIRAKQEIIDPVYLQTLLTIRFMKEHLLKTGESAGSTRQALTKKQIENLRITLPPLELQHEFVEFVNSINSGAFKSVDDALHDELMLIDAQLAEFRNQLLTLPEKAA